MSKPGHSARSRFVHPNPAVRTFTLPGAGVPQDRGHRTEPPLPEPDPEIPHVESIPLPRRFEPHEFPEEIRPLKSNHKFKQEITRLYPKAVEVYRTILEDPDAPVRIRASVAANIIEHQIGKPVQPTADLGGIMGRKSVEEYSDEEIRHLMMVFGGELAGPGPELEHEPKPAEDTSDDIPEPPTPCGPTGPGQG
jgi:hypothetical protein